MISPRYWLDPSSLVGDHVEYLDNCLEESKLTFIAILRKFFKKICPKFTKTTPLAPISGPLALFRPRGGGLQEPPSSTKTSYSVFIRLFTPIFHENCWNTFINTFNVIFGYSSILLRLMKHFGTYVPKIRGGLLEPPSAYSPIFISN